MKSPKYLYHMAYSKSHSSILKSGLIPHKLGVVWLFTKDRVPSLKFREFLDNILFRIDTTGLDHDKLTLRYSENRSEGKFWTYKGVIPPKNIEIVR